LPRRNRYDAVVRGGGGELEHQDVGNGGGLGVGPNPVRAAILDEIEILFAEEDVPRRSLSDEDVLLDTGLDSLAFAVLITRLEDRFECDPFTEMDEPVYPQTLGELVAIYTQFVPASSA
jgi:acyl carrier protein